MSRLTTFFLCLLVFCTLFHPPFAGAFIEFDDQDTATTADNIPVCPIPRTHGEIKGLANGPCGNKLSITDDSSRISLSPGWQTIRWTEQGETLHGSVFRVALSGDGTESMDEYDDCVLLDNIPHHDHFSDDIVHYAISIEIPDVDCPQCALQIAQIGFNQSLPCYFGTECPTDTDCNLCVNNLIYLTCSNIEITGNNSRSDLECTTPDVADGWTFGRTTNKNYSILTDTGAWKDDGTIDLDNKFSSPVGPCGDTLLASGGGDQGSGISTGAAVAITFAVLFVIIVMCAFIYAFLRRRNSGPQSDILLQGNDGQSEYRNIKQETVRGSSMDLDEEDDNRPLPPGWEEFFADDGNPYYYCEATGQTQWERP